MENDKELAQGDRMLEKQLEEYKTMVEDYKEESIRWEKRFEALLKLHISSTDYYLRLVSYYRDVAEMHKSPIIMHKEGCPEVRAEVYAAPAEKTTFSEGAM